jgi:hypothetical protein
MTRNLFLIPLEGEFDSSSIRGRLDSQPDVFLDPHGTGTYVLCGIPEAVPHLWRKRWNDPSRFPYACLVRVSSERVQVDQEMADAEELRSALEFMRWMWSNFKFTIREDGGSDFTEQCRTQGIEFLYPPDVRAMRLPWEGRLIKLGFFRELDHGESNGPSLEDCRAETLDDNEAQIVRYLESGHMHTIASGIVADVLSDDGDVEIGPPHILTDGTYVWPADLSYYVRNYHVRLPKHFVLHAQRNNFQIPGNVDIDSLKLE